MPENEVEKVNQELLKNNPDQTIAPPPIKLQQEPIPNPDLDPESENK